MPTRVLGGMSMAVGSLPYLSVAEAVTVAVSSTDVVTIPTTPRRSPAEMMIAQALIGIDGVTTGQYGALAVDASRIDLGVAVDTDLDHDAFATMRGFLDAAPDFSGPVKWQFVGPVTLGLTLMRAGLPAPLAFEVAAHAVRVHVEHLLAAVATALPEHEQIVVLDEPEFGSVGDAEFAIAPDHAADLLSSALAVIEPHAVAGVHCCGDADWATVLSAGPTLLSLPAVPALLHSAGYLQRFLDRGGWIAWGAVPTDGPLPMSAERPWKRLADLWCQMSQRGCDTALLRQRSLITPACGLGLHSPAIAERLLRVNATISSRVRDQASATRFAFGA